MARKKEREHFSISQNSKPFNGDCSCVKSMRINIYTDIPIDRWHIISTGDTRHFELRCDTKGEYRESALYKLRRVKMIHLEWRDVKSLCLGYFRK